MTARYNSDILLARDEIVAPPHPRACTDRGFELPTGIYVAMALCFVGFVSVLSFAFMGPTLVVPYGVFIAFIAAFFIVPSLWARMAPEESQTRRSTGIRSASAGSKPAPAIAPPGRRRCLRLSFRF
jgi:hypothetical protein